MATANYHSDSYVQDLNAWHLQLGIVGDALKFSILQLDNLPEGLECVLGILEDRLIHLVESCPFPPKADDGDLTPTGE